MKYYLTGFPYLLILKGKHDPSYFLIQSEEDFYKACETIFEWNSIYYPKDTAAIQADIDKYQKEIEPVRETLKQLEGSGIKDESLIRTLKESALKSRRMVLHYMDELEEAELFKKGTREAKVALVMRREGYDYERILKKTFSNG